MVILVLKTYWFEKVVTGFMGRGVHGVKGEIGTGIGSGIGWSHRLDCKVSSVHRLMLYPVLRVR